MNAINELATSALYRLDGSDNEELIREVIYLKRWGNALAMGDTALVQQVADEGWCVEFQRVDHKYFVSIWDTDPDHDECRGNDPDPRHALIKAYLDWQEEVNLA